MVANGGRRETSTEAPGQGSLPLDSDGQLPAEERDQLEREEGLFRIARVREEHAFLAPVPWALREACPHRGSPQGTIQKRGNQNVVRCACCNRHLYNAPKTETDEKPRTVETLRPQIKPSQQARILIRDNFRCVYCGRNDVPPDHRASALDRGRGRSGRHGPGAQR